MITRRCHYEPAFAGESLMAFVPAPRDVFSQPRRYKKLSFRGAPATRNLQFAFLVRRAHRTPREAL